MKDKKYIIELGHANYEDEDLAVDGRRVFEHLSDKVPSIYDVRIGRGAPLNQKLEGRLQSHVQTGGWGWNKRRTPLLNLRRRLP